MCVCVCVFLNLLKVRQASFFQQTVFFFLFFFQIFITHLRPPLRLAEGEGDGEDSAGAVRKLTLA